MFSNEWRLNFNIILRNHFNSLLNIWYELQGKFKSVKAVNTYIFRFCLVAKFAGPAQEKTKD